MSRRFPRRHGAAPSMRSGRPPVRPERPDVRRATLPRSEPDPAAIADVSPPADPGTMPDPHPQPAPQLTIDRPGVDRPGIDRLGALSPEAQACTAAQLRRFIKSRPYVPMHELRRRFELNGGADDVHAIGTPSGTVYVGLPDRESQFIADLVRQGDVGLEICRDPYVPMVVGVYPMRPITRQ